MTTLLVVLLLEGIVSTIAVLALVPLADFLLDPELSAPTRITRLLVALLGRDGNESMFGEFAFVLIAANFVKAVLDIATRHAVLRIKYAVSRELARDALTTFFKARWEFFSGVDHGRLLNTLNRELTTIADTLGHLATQLANAVQLAIYLIVPFWLSPGMTMTALGLAAVLGSPLLLLHKTSYRMGRRGTETANVMIGMLNEAIGASRLVLGFGRQKQSVDRFVHAFDVHTRATLGYQTLSAAAVATVQPLGIVSVLLAVGLGLQRGIPLPEMAALLWSLLRAIPLLGTLMSTNVTIRSFLPAYDQLAKLRDEANVFREIEGPCEFTALREGVSLRQVDFTYPGRAGTLKDINIDIRKGETTALVGESGSGKSTIADLVLALQVPARGDVLLDGRPMTDWRQNSFRERVGYVPQEPILFHASIRDNLLWSCDRATDDELWRACAMANADIFVRDLPQGMDTIVGDRGIRLSGGQRQRIALARALLRKPELLILDEATSALDSESEQLIQRAINELSRDSTILVIAHRLSTISRADRVYVLDAGRVVEEGGYAELAHKPNGVLASMIAVQRHGEPRAAAAR